MSAIESITQMFVPPEARQLTEAHKKVVRELQQSNAEVKQVARDVIAANRHMKNADADGRLGTLIDIYA